MIRLRQVVVMTSDLPATVTDMQSKLGLGEGFEDKEVRRFGLENSVLPVGDCFVEVLTPTTKTSAGARHLARHGKDVSYMAIFQVDDTEAARSRATGLGIRIVWKSDLDDISATHLDPRDIGGAIVSLDTARPPESWRWAGPAWTGHADPERAEGGLSSLTVAVPEPGVVAARWAGVLGEGAELESVGSVGGPGNEHRVVLSEAGQWIDFVELGPGELARITRFGLALAREPVTATIAGVTFYSNRTTRTGAPR